MEEIDIFIEYFLIAFSPLQHKTLHKEELVKSEAEKTVRKNIQTKAPLAQQKKTMESHAQKTAKVTYNCREVQIMVVTVRTVMR